MAIISMAVALAVTASWRVQAQASSGFTLEEAAMPNAPGKAETIQMCHNCHEAEFLNHIGLSRKGWEEVIDRMFERGAVGNNREVGLVVNYLATNFTYQLDINTAIVMEFRRYLSLSEADAEAAVAYRTQHGPFKGVVDLEAVPGINVQKIRERREILVARPTR